MKEENLCSVCNEEFKCDDEVIIVNDEIYHKDCVSLYPSSYVVYVEGEFIGESENEDGFMACEYIDFGED